MNDPLYLVHTQVYSVRHIDGEKIGAFHTVLRKCLEKLKSILDKRNAELMPLPSYQFVKTSCKANQDMKKVRTAVN